MATYNGHKFIKQQLQSILPQLNQHDEIIVVDDCSMDGTIEEILSISDDRIKIYRNLKNIGVVASFNHAISMASGEIIFLSDQDDVWSDNKVDEIINLFRDFPKVTLVISDALLIDENNFLISESYFKLRGGFRSGCLSNIIKNKYLGCCMAIRREVLPQILPIPNKVPMHDIWIGHINNIYGKIYFINKPLISYRRHKNNLTTLNHSPFKQMLKWRLQLIKYLFFRILKYS